jgi:glycosyltransferase involved in cell wall biosynthesis
MSRPEPVDNPLSIWIVNPLDDIPGENLPPQRSWSLARILASRGHDVTWWSATWSHRRKAIRSAPVGVLEDEGFTVRLAAVRPYDNDMSLARFASHRDFGRTFERLANESIAAGQLERPDIILASLPPLDGAEAAARIARRLDAEFVVDVLEIWPEILEPFLPGPTLLRPFTKRLLLGDMHRRRDAILAAADAIVASSQGCIDAVAKAASADLPRLVIPLGGHPQPFPPPPRMIDHVPMAAGTPAPHPPGRTHRPLACVHVGRLGVEDDFETLTAAVRQLSTAGVEGVVHVVGIGRRVAALRTAAEAMKGPFRMMVHGLLDLQEWIDLLVRCDIGLVLAKPESVTALPPDAFDYAAAGLAIVSGLRGDLAQCLAEAGSGMAYSSGDPASLARVIKTLDEDRPQLLQMRQASRRLAEQMFDREKLAAAHADWLEGLCRRG